MMETPTAAQFNELAMAAERYGKLFYERGAALAYGTFDEEISEDEIVSLSIHLSNANDEAWDLSLGTEGLFVLNWLHEQPAFCLAKEALGFVPLDQSKGWQPRFEQIIRRWASRKNRHGGTLVWSIERESKKFLSYLSGIAKAAHGYITKRRVRAAIDGPEKIEKIKSLLVEIEQLLATEWIPENHRNNLLRLINTRKAINLLENQEIISAPLSRRNDTDLPARLMASEIIRLHHELFSATHKRAVFHLMGLAFIERPLEMRTIERLAKAEKDRLSQSCDRRNP